MFGDGGNFSSEEGIFGKENLEQKKMILAEEADQQSQCCQIRQWQSNDVQSIETICLYVCLMQR